MEVSRLVSNGIDEAITSLGEVIQSSEVVQPFYFVQPQEEDFPTTDQGEILSRPFDVLLFSNHKSLRKALDEIIIELKPDLGVAFERDPKAYKQTAKLVILNLFEAWNEHEEMYVSYSRDKSKFSFDSRYRKLHIRFNPFVNVIDALDQHGYLEGMKGFFDRETGIGFQSKMRATPKLISNLVLKKFEWQMVQRRKEAPILLRDENKNAVEFDLNRDIKDKKSNVNLINKFLANQEITFEPPNWAVKEMWREKIRIPNTNRNQLTRIFNETWDDGGRFYRHWSQGLPSKYRKYIRINGQQVTELDYSSIHPYILYSKEGLHMPDEDMYSLDGMGEGQRKICKTILLTIFNVKEDQDAIKAVMTDLHRKGIRSKRNEIEHLIERLKEKHHPIKEYFGSGIGRQLQRIDSDIAENIMLRLLDQDIPCLPIHDSFIVAQKHKQALRQAMIEEAKAITGFEPRVEEKY